MIICCWGLCRGMFGTNATTTSPRCMDMLVHIYTRVHVCTHALAHTHTHSHTHTQLLTLSLACLYPSTWCWVWYPERVIWWCCSVLCSDDAHDNLLRHRSWWKECCTSTHTHAWRQPRCWSTSGSLSDSSYPTTPWPYRMHSSSR